MIEYGWIMDKYSFSCVFHMIGLKKKQQLTGFFGAFRGHRGIPNQKAPHFSMSPWVCHPIWHFWKQVKRCLFKKNKKIDEFRVFPCVSPKLPDKAISILGQPYQLVFGLQSGMSRTCFFSRTSSVIPLVECRHRWMLVWAQFESPKVGKPHSHHSYLVGGIPTPLKNMSSSVGVMKFPTEWKVIKAMFQTTNQMLYPLVN